MKPSRSNSHSHVLKPDDILPAASVGDHPGLRVATSSRVVRRTGHAVQRATDITLGDLANPGAPSRGPRPGHGLPNADSSTAGARSDGPSEADVRAELRRTLEQDLNASFEARAAATAAEHERQLAELQARHEDEIQQAVATVAALVEGWGAAAAKFYEDAERDLVALAVDTANAVTDRSLTDAEINAVTQSLGWAMEQLAGDGPIDVRVSPLLLDRMEKLNIMPQTETRHPVRWHVDKALDEGDYVALTATASIRAVRAEAIERARAQLLAHTRRDGADGDAEHTAADPQSGLTDPTT